MTPLVVLTFSFNAYTIQNKRTHAAHFMGASVICSTLVLQRGDEVGRQMGMARIFSFNGGDN